MSQVKEQIADYQLAALSPVLRAADSCNILLESLPVWLSTQTRKSAGRGRSANNTLQYGVQKLRELILELAVRGKLVPQDVNDEPAIGLINPIHKELEELANPKKSRKSKSLNEISTKDYPYELPQGWVLIRNGNLFKLRKGKKPRNLTESISGAPYLDIEALDRGNIIRYTDDESCPKASSEDILVVCDGSRSGLVLDGMNGVIGSTLAVIQTPKWLQQYIKLIFSHGFRRWNTSMKGAAIPHLDTKKLITEITALPPLNEQHRIVKKVDELMALCDQLEQQQADAIQAHDILVKVLLEALTQSENAEDFQQNWRRIAEHFDTLFTTESSIDQLKQTLLQLAVMGKLVPQEPNDEPASILLKKIAEEKVRLVKEGKIKKQQSLPLIEDKPFSIPSNWQFSYLQNVCSLITDGTHQTPTYTETGRPFVSAQCVKPFLFMPENCRYVSEEHYQEYVKNRKPEKDDILLSRVGAGIGEAAIIDTDLEFAIYVSTGLLKPFKQFVMPRYLLIWLNSPTGRYASASKTLGKGVSQGNLNLSLIRSFIVSIPPTAEQSRIVKKVDELMALCDQLKDRLNQAKTLQQQLANAVVESTINFK